MESNDAIFKNASTVPTKKSTRTHQNTLKLIISFTLTTLLFMAPFIWQSSSSSSSTISMSINSSSSSSSYSSSLHFPLETAINETIKSVSTARTVLTGFLTVQDLVPHEKTALLDCLEMLDQTLHELTQSIVSLHQSPSASKGRLHSLYTELQSLLSAAMTNEDTCINGFSDLDRYGFGNHEKEGLKQSIQDLLTPISRMMSNCLSMITYFGGINRNRILNDQRKFDNKIAWSRFPLWIMSSSDRILMRRVPRIRPNITVARDGTGDFRVIGEAIQMAPNRSTSRFVIKIKTGVYNETVVISREKVNIMLIGEGMTKTIIAGSKNFVDGFSTINSATLTVTGDKFLARDLTILNTAGPYKYQAVAARITSNSAFYRCNFSSYQDTLFAHSLHQFYYECTIKGTIDFIFGNAAAVFQNCLILIRKPIPGQKNMVTAQGRDDPNQSTGISLQNCTIAAAEDFSVTERLNVSTFLGRPWRNYSRTIIAKSYLGDLINPRGWSSWNQYSNLATVEYIEYLNYGPGSDTSHRVNWKGYQKNCSEEFLKQFVVDGFLCDARFPLFSTS